MSAASGSQTTLIFPQALLAEHGPPTLDVLSNLMSRIDQQLAQHDKQMEETLEKLVEATNGLSSDNMYTNIKDAMDSLIHTSVLEECACLPPDSEDVNKLLKIIIDHITAHPGSEGIVFQQFLLISSHEGMTLPIRAPKLESVAASSLSLNTVSDKMEIENDSLWEDIRCRIKKHFLDQLRLIKSDDIYASPSKRVELLQSLCILYPVHEVWVSYENVRSQQTMRVLHQHFIKIPGEILSEAPGICLKDLCEILPSLILELKKLMEEDFNLFMVGVFEQEVDLKTALWKIYISKLSEELQGHLDTISSQKRKSAPVANGHATTYQSVPSLSEALSQTSFDERLTGSFPLSNKEIKMLISVAKSLSSLNDFYKSLCYQASWDTTLAFKLPMKGKGSLKGVLKHKKDRDNKGTGLQDYQRKGILPDAIPPPFGATPAMMSDGGTILPSSDIILETPASQKNKWNWCYLLENFLPALVESFCQDTKEILTAKLKEEDASWHEQGHMNSTQFSYEGDLKDIFKGYETCRITQSTSFLISSFALLTHLEPIWWELPLRYFKFLLTNASKESIQVQIDHLTKKKEYFASQHVESTVTYNVKELYVILASVAVLLKWLRESDFAGTEEDFRQTFGRIDNQLEELQSGLLQQIELFHDQLIQSTVLQDAESHHWQDQKPFFEDERCSFSVQMWNLYMERLRNELWTFCPPEQARDIFGSVFGKSLQFLSQRYSRAKPSYNRTKQFRCDILFILASALEHLFAAADSIQKVLPVSLSIQAHPMSHIHNPCINLLAPLAVVTAPLPDLYKIFKKGYGQRQRFREDKDPGPSWLGWIWPELFEKFQSLSEMPDSSAIFLAVKLLKRQPRQHGHPLLLQSLLMRNSLLPCLLAREVGKPTETVPKYEYDNTPAKFEEFPADLERMFFTMTRLLAVCSDFPKSLGSFLLALVEREYSYSGSKLQETLILDDAPLWMRCTMKLLQPCFVRCLEQTACQLSTEIPNNPPGFLESLRQLPCGCRIRSKGQMLQKKDNEEIFLKACKVFLSTLVSEVTSLPLSVSIFMQRLESLLPPESSNVSPKSVGLKLVLQILFMFMRNECQVTSQLKEKLSDKYTKQLCQIGQLACILLLGRTLDDADVSPNLLQEFHRQHGEWLKDTVNLLNEHFHKKELSQQQDLALGDTPMDFQEGYYQMLYQLVSSYPDVMSGLSSVYSAVADNVEWIQKIMEIPQMPLLTPPVRPPSFELKSISGDNSEPFNPINQINKFGDNSFTFAHIAEFPVDWKGLLQSEIGLTKTSFQFLLSHRHDLQEGAYLEEFEKKAVRALQAKYNLERADLV